MSLCWKIQKHAWRLHRPVKTPAPNFSPFSYMSILISIEVIEIIWPMPLSVSTIPNHVHNITNNAVIKLT